jgi:hypothetical protein
MRELCQGCEDAEQRPGASCASVARSRNRLSKCIVRRSLSARAGILGHDRRTPQQADGLRHRALQLEWRERPDAAWIDLRRSDHGWWRCDRVEGLRPPEHYRKFGDLRRVRRQTISIPEAGQRVGHCRLRTVAALETQAHCSNRAPGPEASLRLQSDGTGSSGDGRRHDRVQSIHDNALLFTPRPVLRCDPLVSSQIHRDSSKKHRTR